MTKYSWPISSEMVRNTYSPEAVQVIEDYCVLCFILGNDFLPHAATLQLKKNGYEKLLWCGSHAFKSYERLILENGELNMQFVTSVFQQLSSSEDEQLWKNNEEYLKKRAYDNHNDPFDSYPLKNKSPLATEIYNNKPNKWRTFYYKHLFHTRLHDTSVITESCTLYVQGILWTYRYYKRMMKDPSWYYPFAYPPTFQDLANFTASITQEDEKALWTEFVQLPHQGFVHPHVQLLCIMPRESAICLPQQVRKIITDDTHPCSYMFPSLYPIETYMKYHLWECTPVLPFLDVRKIETMV